MFLKKYGRLFVSPQVDFILANTAYPDEMPHYAAFHLGALFARLPVMGLRSSKG